ncbi:EscU/YscU/HrcU family type III secretion system export apparatus switch protein [Rouxiella badensis]|uniref:EscU/YscU/HrcU family type III secretion system export apparatus switch protein n=1 Tax=Rouxiella badensis TaxID=1646377 RepID=UPI001D138E82|nr:EscU/YscU/HrcU family type III secretion system export apparatus switch protein [Rouxiella badensis]MCC3719453.1 EscU/YscU/HrcU family type III secretion system export apparatus switch protein [Rouxiella badensis]MCC3728703.1 EscU/YscU/HrcU family type III secretion system export apparatus switch protein [Rouxiella badensis]MCC3734264.1 EscU/YscU/HrcU family type III secretion system export apparatus switch protein [Rouxiella badensis]MCC3739301.1 EscU/YscU/HrcU family type III secretion sys
MSLSKTEKPTQKKISDAVKKGQSFKSKDLVITCLILAGVNYIITLDFIKQMAGVWGMIIEDGFKQNIADYASSVFILALKIIIPFLLLCVFCTTLPSLLQTGFVLATKIFKLNFGALNPINGTKKLFSLRTVKDTVKAVLYLLVFIIIFMNLWSENKILFLLQRYGTPQQTLVIWGHLIQRMVTTCLLGMIIIMLLDAIAEYFLYIKDLKMDKQEVKRERIDQDGNPLIKSTRRSLHSEILDEQTKLDITNSKVIIANPTHIAIGIYFNADIVPIPFISVLETNQCALSVRRYAKKMGVPVLEDIALARRIYKSHSKYSFISVDELDAVLQILVWLEQVDNAWQEDQPSLISEASDEVNNKNGENERSL